MTQSPPMIAGLLVIAALVFEWVWARRHQRAIYHRPELICNGIIFVGNTILKAVTAAWAIWILGLIEPLALWHLPNTKLVFIATLILADLAYYWYHRLSHEVSALWALHHTHHSSIWLNLTTAVRLNWLGKFVSPIFFAPLVVFGLPAEFVGLSVGLVLFYQFFLHTQSIPPLGRFEGVLLNTPSAHRVHHGSNPVYIDKNYGGILVIWDRLFGTYEPESEPVRFGVTTGSVGHNPLVVQWRPLWQYYRGEWQREKHRVKPGLPSQDSNSLLS